MRRFALLGPAAALVLSVAGCASEEATDTKSADAVSGNPDGKLCVALRGNGHYIITHFNALAKIHELYGKVDTIAGGSSSTVSMFVYESMRANDVVRQCDNGMCSDRVEAERLALLLKSVRGYAEAVGVADGVLGADGALSLKKAMDEQGVVNLLASNPRDAARKIQTILDPATIARLGLLLNTEFAILLNDQKVAGETLDAGTGTAAAIAAATARLTFASQEIYDAISTFGNFKVDNNRMFFRPGLLNFEKAASTTFATAGNFYAGKDATGDGSVDAAGMKLFLDSCAARSVGLPWRDPTPGVEDKDKKDIEHLSMGGDFADVGTTCADFFKATALQSIRYLNTHPIVQSRVEDNIGLRENGVLRVNSIAVTSVLTGASVPAYNAALDLYRSGTVASPSSVPFDVKWSDLKIGYWGAFETLETMIPKLQASVDPKSSKAMSLGVTQWKEILKRSPAEPGLARGVKIDEENISLGGWPDLAPVLALKEAGCERVVYVTRQRPESPFAIGIAKLLGMNGDQEKELYDLDNLDSSFTQSISAASAVMCTDWNRFTDGQQDEMAVESYNAPFETKDPYFARAGANVTERTGKAGCTVGVK